MLNGRLYRAAFVPFLLALAVAAFSLGSRPAPLTSTLAPDAFEGARAYAELQSLVRRFPRRRAGSRGDERLARFVVAELDALGGTAGGGFAVHTFSFHAQTIDGERALSTVVATRPGSTSESPIVILAHRDAAAAGAAAELSGTAALLELARVFAARETKRTIVLASTSGGSGGDAGAAQLLSELASVDGGASGAGPQGPIDAAIALGDVAGTRTRAPLVIPYSADPDVASLELQRTLAAAIRQVLGVDPGAPSLLGQLAHLAFPLSLGEQGALNAGGVPAVLVQASGERGPSPAQAVSMERLEGFGRAVLSAVDALDAGPDLAQATQGGVVLQRKTMPSWALRLLVLTLLAPVLVAALDGLARARRRRLAVGRWALWAAGCALPFFAGAVLAYVLGWLGVLGATPAAPVLPSALALGGRTATAVAAVALTFALTWLLWAALMRRLGWGVRPDPDIAGLSLVLVLLPVGVLAWIGDPLTALLAVPALHLWLVLDAPQRLAAGPLSRRLVSLALVVLGLLPLAAVIAFYGDQLGMGAGDIAWTGVLMLAAGQVGLGGAILWSLAFGCAAAAAIVALAPRRAAPGIPETVGVDVTIRGPLSYAGPGSLGGTESALRR
jgi:peptidase M28-like protein